MPSLPRGVMFEKEMYSFSPTFYLRAQKKYGGKYIARKGNRVLVSAKNLKDLLKIMKKRKIDRTVPVSVGYVPASRSIHVYINQYTNWSLGYSHSVCFCRP